MAPVGGEYQFDVSEASEGGSAGSVTLIAQMLLILLAFAESSSRVMLVGGTHVPWSPSFHYLDQVLLPSARKIGLDVDVRLNTWGWYPVGGGEVEMVVQPVATAQPITWRQRGDLVRVTGVAGVTNLPSHIPQRMANRAMNLLAEEGMSSQVVAKRERGPAPGAGIWLTAEYACGPAGFSALGKRGKPAEHVAEEAVDNLLRHHRAGADATVDPHLADQLMLPLALADGPSVYSTSEITSHTLTNARIIRQFLATRINTEPTVFGGVIEIEGIGHHV
jgi:RNA 3'-terminal phosphate cyclase (ATP)